MRVAELPLRYTNEWLLATQHPMLAAVRSGSLPQAAFESWLAQDYLFVGYLLRFQARLLARAPRFAQAVLAAGAAALVAELTWFENQAQARDITLAVQPEPATNAYHQILEDLDRADVPIAVAMLWTIERTYLDAWSFAAPGAAAYREFVDRWTAPGFADYVADLAGIADQLGPKPDVDHRFLAVVDAEITFWDMAWQR